MFLYDTIDKNNDITEDFVKNTNYTSDHLYRRINLKFSRYYNNNYFFYDENFIKGFTFNLLSRCFNIEEEKNKGFSNNPLNISENENSYINRKLIQFDLIEKLMLEKDSSFILLQEIDFLFYDKYKLKVKSELRSTRVEGKEENKMVTPIWMLRAIRELKKKFILLLNKNNWDCVACEDREIAILTNSYKLEKIDNTLSINLPSSNKTKNINILLTCGYHFKDFNCNIILGTLHAYYNEDYSTKLNNLLINGELNNKIKNNLITIIGGDTNRPPSLNINGLLTSGDNIATNFQTNYQYINKLHINNNGYYYYYPIITNNNKKYTKVLLNDERNTTLSKAYDGFIISTKNNINNIKLDYIIVSGDQKWSYSTKVNKFMQPDDYIKLINEYSENLYCIK